MPEVAPYHAVFGHSIPSVSCTSNLVSKRAHDPKLHGVQRKG